MSRRKIDKKLEQEADSADLAEEIQVEFEGRSPNAGDFDGVRQFLQQVFLKAHVNIPALADVIIGQKRVGSVIVQCESDGEDDSDDETLDENTIFGVTTIINISAHNKVEYINQLHSYILEKTENSQVDILKKVLESPENSIGFFVNERFVNIPALICIPLFEILLKEIHEMEAIEKSYKFTHILAIIKFHREEATKSKSSEELYSNPEEEMFCKHAITTFEFSVLSEMDAGISGSWIETDSNLIPYRKIALFEADKFYHMLATVKQFLTNKT